MTLRVLQVVTQMNRGGLETRLMDLYREVDRDRVQFDFLTFRGSPGSFDSEIRSLGGRVYYGDPLSGWTAPTIPRKLSLFLRNQRDYKVIHAHMNSWCGPILEGARTAGVPIRIAHARGADESKTVSGLYKRRLRHCFRRAATHRLAVSETAGLWLYGAEAVAKGMVEIVPNAIDVGTLEFDRAVRAKTRHALGVSDSFVLIHVGNLMRVKNHELVLRVFSEVRRSVPDSVLLLAGEGPERQRLAELCEMLDLTDSVKFLGSRDDIPALLQAADLFVFPSFHEGMPGAVLEAQAAGLPCLISDVIDTAVSVLPTTKALSLEKSPGEWARVALEMPPADRSSGAILMRQAGYDVGDISERMTKKYIALAERH